MVRYIIRYPTGIKKKREQNINIWGPPKENRKHKKTFFINIKEALDMGKLSIRKNYYRHVI